MHSFEDAVGKKNFKNRNKVHVNIPVKLLLYKNEVCIIRPQINYRLKYEVSTVILSNCKSLIRGKHQDTSTKKHQSTKKIPFIWNSINLMFIGSAYGQKTKSYVFLVFRRLRTVITESLKTCGRLNCESRFKTTWTSSVTWLAPFR